MKKRVLFILLVLLLNINLVSAATYYISPSGDDTTGDGSNGNPWKTLYSVVWGSHKAVNGDTIVMKDGYYVENMTTLNTIYTNVRLTITGETRGGATLTCGNCTVTDNPVLYMGGSGGTTTISNININNSKPFNHCLWFYGAVGSIVVENVSFYNCRDGIRFASAGGSITDAQIRNNYFEGNSSSAGYALNIPSTSSNINITNNTFTKRAYFSIATTNNVVFSDNNLTGDLIVDNSLDTYRSGINLIPRTVSMNNINFATPYYIDGKNWTFNRVNESFEIIELNNVSNLIIRNNSFGSSSTPLSVYNRNTYTAYGVQINSNSKHILITNNTFHLGEIFSGVDVATLTNSGMITNISVTNNNLYINRSNYGFEIEECVNNSRIINNTVYAYSNNASHILALGREDDRVGYSCYGLKKNAEISNNIVYGHDVDDNGPAHVIFVGYFDNITVRNNYVYGGEYSYVIKGNNNGIVENNTAINSTYNGILHKGGSHIVYANNTIRGNPNYADSWLLPIYRDTSILNESNVTNISVINNVLISDPAITNSITLLDGITVNFVNNTISNEGPYTFDIRENSSININDSRVIDKYDLLKVGSNDNVTNFSVTNYSGYSFFINRTNGLYVNITNSSIYFNVYKTPAQGAFTNFITMNDLTQALAYNLNGSVYWSSNLNENNGTRNFTLPSGNRTYVLNNYIINESETRIYKPVLITGSGTQKIVNSTLLSMINTTLVHNATSCDINTYTASFNFSSRSCTGAIVTLLGAEVGSGEGSINITYTSEDGGDDSSGGSSPLVFKGGGSSGGASGGSSSETINVSGDCRENCNSGSNELKSKDKIVFSLNGVIYTLTINKVSNNKDFINIIISTEDKQDIELTVNLKEKLSIDVDRSGDNDITFYLDSINDNLNALVSLESIEIEEEVGVVDNSDNSGGEVIQTKILDKNIVIGIAVGVFLLVAVVIGIMIKHHRKNKRMFKRKDPHKKRRKKKKV